MASDELPAPPRTRASDPELAALLRRMAASGAEIGRLQTRIAELEGVVRAGSGAGHGERERLLALLASERAGRRAVTQSLRDERDRRAQLEAALELVRSPWGAGADRELAAARRRVAALEGELETVRRHDAEFEQAIRLAVGEAWAWLAELGGRLEAALAEVAKLRSGPGAGGPRVAGDGDGPGEGAGVTPEALDQARSRLRESPAGDGGERPLAGGESRRRGWRRR